MLQDCLLANRSCLACMHQRVVWASWAVPRLFAEVRQFVDMSNQFLENIGLSNTEVDEMLRQSTNHLLSKVFPP